VVGGDEDGDRFPQRLAAYHDARAESLEDAARVLANAGPPASGLEVPDHRCRAEPDSRDLIHRPQQAQALRRQRRPLASASRRCFESVAAVDPGNEHRFPSPTVDGPPVDGAAFHAGLPQTSATPGSVFGAPRRYRR
jgi:hypothetical protein